MHWKYTKQNNELENWYFVIGWKKKLNKKIFYLLLIYISNLKPCK